MIIVIKLISLDSSHEVASLKLSSECEYAKPFKTKGQLNKHKKQSIQFLLYFEHCYYVSRNKQFSTIPYCYCRFRY